MTGTELVGQVQRITNDIAGAWTPTQYLEAINAGIVSIANTIVQRNDEDLLTSESIVNGGTVPEYFIRFAGTFPVGRVDGKYVCSGAMTVKYFRMPTALTVIGDTIPFRDRRNIEALKLATAIYLKEQRGTFDMSNEKTRLAELLA